MQVLKVKVLHIYVQVRVGFEWCGVTLYLQVFLVVQRTMWPFLPFWCSWCTRHYPQFYLRFLRLEVEPHAACCHLLLQVLMVMQLLHVAVRKKHKIINQMKRFKKCCNILSVPFLIFYSKNFNDYTNHIPQVWSCASDTYALKILKHAITWVGGKRGGDRGLLFMQVYTLHILVTWHTLLPFSFFSIASNTSVFMHSLDNEYTQCWS